MKMFLSFWTFIQYWYMRYLLVTELYMVEKWERVMIHIVFFIIFATISMLNVSIILQAVKLVIGNTGNLRDVHVEPMVLNDLEL